MTEMNHENVFVQRDWTDEALTTDGFVSYRPIKRITMMRMLPSNTKPEIIEDRDISEQAEVVEFVNTTHPARPTYWMAYRMGNALKSPRNDFDQRPIESHIFAETYHHWDDVDWQPTADESHLQRLGCTPYYKTASIWAKQLTVETWVKGRESAKPFLAPVGAWLCVDTKGEPRMMEDAGFHEQYHLPRQKKPSAD